MTTRPSFPPICPLAAAEREAALRPPLAAAPPRRMILDTDTFNEVDDQFAVVHALLSPESLRVEGVHAAPFVNVKASSPDEGMERSHEEILRLCAALGRKPEGLVRRGARAFIGRTRRPVESEAVEALLRQARVGRGPLYVVAIGAPTNVASALLIDPSIARRIVVVWLGGHGEARANTREFNLRQDPEASRVLFESGVPLVWLPCFGVTSHMLTTREELRGQLAGGSPVARFLLERVENYAPRRATVWSKVVWDLAATAWVVNPAWLPSALVPAPRFDAGFRWREVPSDRHRVRRVRFVDRDAVFRDFFAKVGRLAAAPRVSHE